MNVVVDNWLNGLVDTIFDDGTVCILVNILNHEIKEQDEFSQVLLSEVEMYCYEQGVKIKNWIQYEFVVELDVAGIPKITSWDVIEIA